ncbi:replication-relaxation family protein [Streptomyces turgidiscabies]|uniref:replication-relaxation family protein n=1 Tax=Streptomyces turgidiscabies TaxID=85558 RepID=UPI0038F5F20B
MFLIDRDAQIVHAVNAFGQLTSGHVRALFFKGLSDTPADRRLRILTDRKYLARLERPNPGGNKGGRGQFIYQLGPMGWKLCRGDSRYWPYRAVNPHTLSIASAYVAIKSLEQGGRFEVTRYATEPKNWRTIGGVELRPDLYVEVVDHQRQQSYAWWVEVDMGTERKAQIKEKLERYYHAWEHSADSGFETWPLVVFLVPDVERQDELQRLIRQGTEDAQALFEVRLSNEFPPAGLSM